MHIAQADALLVFVVIRDIASRLILDYLACEINARLDADLNACRDSGVDLHNLCNSVAGVLYKVNVSVTSPIKCLMTDPDYAELKDALGLNKDSKVLLFSTEGDTDPDKYKSIVWGGEYATV